MNDLQSSLSALVPWVSRQRGQRLKRKLECLYESGFKLEAFQVPSDDSESDSDAPDHRYYSHNFDFASFVDSQLVLTQLTVGWLQCVAFSAQVAFSQRLKTPEAETSTKGERIAATGCQWVAIVLDVLREHLLNKRHPSSYGSDCSGLDAPWWALRELFMGMKAADVEMKDLIYDFASEAPGQEGIWQKRMLLLNATPSGPNIIFNDMFAFGKRIFHDMTDPGQVVNIPEVDWYTGGFECQDLSTLNVARKELTLDIDEQSGMSSKTLVKSLEYVQEKKPAYIIIENVARKNTADTVLSALRRIGYECVAVFTNSASFGVPQSRTRLYIAGVWPAKVKIIHGPEQWIQWLEDICKMSKTTGFASSLLPDDDEQVQSMLSQRQQMEMNPADMLVALKTGETWPKCFAKHLEARAHLSSLLEREVPTHEELLATFGNHWSKTLPAREQDILYLHLWALEHHRGSTDPSLIWDLTHNITFQQWKEHAYEDTLPCLLRNHRYWHVGRRRHLVPG
ncbi:unnamed protein product [Durusdinium trenchii]|uniref:Uncharacterized protein n=2 Tax=Durusdinium trenchii TaxID=1381693 RepID=A0ABP0HVC3_9DINO